MTTATPLPPSSTADFPPPPPEPPRNGHTLLWLVLGGLALLLAVGLSTILFLSGGEDDSAAVDDESALINDHNGEADEPTLIDVPGYTYEDPPSDAIAAWDKVIMQGNEEQRAMWPRLTGDFFTAWSVHKVNTDPPGKLTVLFLAETNPQLLDRPGWDPELMVTGMAGAMAGEGSAVTTETIDGEDVAFMTERDSDDVAFAWYHGGTMHLVYATGEDETRAFVEAYITQQNS